MRNFLLILILVISSACASKTTIRHASDLQSAIARSNHVALIMPPVVEVNMVDIASKKSRMYDYEYHLENILYQQIIPALQEQGIRTQILHRRTLHDQDLARDAASMRERYQEIRDLLYKEILWNKERAFNIVENTGPFAMPIGLKNHGDLLIMVDYARDVKTSGARTRDFMMDLFLGTSASNDADKSILIIAIIDAKNGKLLWTNMGINMRDVIGSAIDNTGSEDELAQERIKTMLTNMFENFNQE